MQAASAGRDLRATTPADGVHLETMAGISGCRAHPVTVGVSAHVCRGIKKSIKIQKNASHSGSSPFVCQRMEAQNHTTAFVAPKRQTGNRLITIILKNKSRSLRFELNINNNHHKSSINLTVACRNGMKSFCLAKRNRAE